MDLRNNEDDRPYRGVNRAQYTQPQDDAYGYDDTMTTQAYYRERLRGMTEQRWFPLAAVTLGVVLFGTLIAFAYRQGADTSANGATPLIQAENGDYKSKPVAPGGMDVPFQDAVVFDQIDTTKVADANGGVENLLPPPEQPVDAGQAKPAAGATTPVNTLPSAPRPAADKGVIADAATGNSDPDSVADKIAATEADLKTKTGDKNNDSTGEAAAAIASASETVADKAALNEATATAMQLSRAQSAAEPATVKNVPAATTAATIAKTAPAAKTEQAAPQVAAIETVKPAAKTAAIKPATVKPVTVTAAAVPAASPAAKMNAVAPAAPTPAPTKTGGSAKVQLGAFKDENAARSAWASLQKQYAPHLDGVTPNYARADLGAKGVFYRVQGVNLSSTQAKDICSAINAAKPGACIIPQ